MTRWQQVSIVAWWEFNRFVKWKQQLIGVAIMVTILAASVGLGRFVKNARSKPVDVAVVRAERLGYALPSVEGITWVSDRYTDEAAVRAAVEGDSIDGALLITAADSAVVLVRKRAAWTTRAEAAFAQAHQAAQFTRLPISADQRAALLTPFALRVSTLRTSDADDVAAARFYGNVMLGIGLLVLFNGFASLFAGITGEKQQRITEQMLSMVSPQTWIDGKILGLAGAAAVGTVITAATVLVGLMIMPLFMGSDRTLVPPMPTQWGTLLLIAIITALGVAMWFAFMAAVAATIDDPNSSPRSILLMVPTLPTAFAFALVSRADSVVAQVLAVFPLTSMSVLPVRLLAMSVPWWEPVLAILLLAGTVALLRRAAGKIFATGVLLYGKEPSLLETLRWAREA
ncbi:MAG: ABC transporter permease [Gemmatimonadaceae bacterium]